jgi:hypothetical protein
VVVTCRRRDELMADWERSFEVRCIMNPRVKALVQLNGKADSSKHNHSNRQDFCQESPLSIIPDAKAGALPEFATARCKNFPGHNILLTEKVWEGFLGSGFTVSSELK